MTNGIYLVFPFIGYNTFKIKADVTEKRKYTSKASQRADGAIWHRAAICQLLGSPERNNSSPHLAASTNNPVGGRHLAKLWNPWWSEDRWRDNRRGRKTRTTWERLGRWGIGHGWEAPQRKMFGTAR